MQKILFKKLIPKIFLDKEGNQHATSGEAYKATSTPPKVKEGTGVYSDFIYQGIFHKWTLEGDMENGLQTYGIVQLLDGTIEMMETNRIKFLP